MPEPDDRALASFEVALASLQPAAAALNRDELAFRAGQESVVPRRHGVWPSVAAALALLCTGLTGALVWRPAPEPHYVYVPVVPTTPAPTGDLAPKGPSVAVEPPYSPEWGPLPEVGGYLQIRAQVLRWGVEALPDAPPLSADAPATRDDPLLERGLHRSKGSF